MQLTRRHVLAASSALAAAGVLSCAGLRARWWDQAPGAGLSALSADEHAFVQALAEAWMPAGGTPALSGADARLGDFVDAVLAEMREPERSLLKLLLQALDDATIPTHLAAFTSLPLDARTAALQGWVDARSSTVRQAIRAVLALLSEGWTQHPDVVAVLRPEFPCGIGR